MICIINLWINNGIMFQNKISQCTNISMVNGNQQVGWGKGKKWEKEGDVLILHNDSKEIMFTCDKQDIEVSAFILNYKSNQWKTIDII